MDHNATTPVDVRVFEAAKPYFLEHWGNPSSTHSYGGSPKKAIAKAREQVAALIGAQAEQIVFTSGGTESNNLCLLGCKSLRTPAKIITSVIEHPAVLLPVLHLKERGWPVEVIPVNTDGRVSLKRLEQSARNGASLLSFMHANNETGTIQPLQDISAIARKHGALLHSDAAQSVGKIDVNVDELNVDFLTIAGHKLYAPKGIGALFVRDPKQLHPVFLGGQHEFGVRPGTPNVPYIVALGAACELARLHRQQEEDRLSTLRDQLWQRLTSSIPGMQRNGSTEHCLPNTLSVRFPGVHGADLLARCPAIAASTGSACHEGQLTPSSVIIALGVPKEEALCTVRLSLGRSTSTLDVEVTASALIKSCLG